MRKARLGAAYRGPQQEIGERCGLGVTFVIPVHNGVAWIDSVIEAVFAQDDGHDFEIVVIDDGSNDGSSEILTGWAQDPRIQLVNGEGRGAAAALNLGFAQARHPLIAQVDQDVIIAPGWLSRLRETLAENPSTAAAQGYYTADRHGSIWQRIAGYELEMRYATIAGDTMDHVCTGNTIYRALAVAEIGGFDDSLGYGYDNDLSYRLGQAGYRLAFRRDAKSTHHWREGLSAYLRQQYGLGYGRLDLVAKHPRRVSGDQVSDLSMILHVPGTWIAVAAAATAAGLAFGGGPWWWPAALAVLTFVILGGERLWCAARAAERFRDPVALLIAPAHLLRDLAWLMATVVWSFRRLRRRTASPDHSMTPGAR